MLATWMMFPVPVVATVEPHAPVDPREKVGFLIQDRLGSQSAVGN